MKYQGNQPITDRHVKLSDISGDFDGACTTFELTTSTGQSITIPSADCLMISLGGVIQEPETAYTLSNRSIVFAQPPIEETDFFGIATVG